MNGDVGRRVRPVVGPEMGERHVADTQLVEHPERRRGALDGVAALEADHRGDTPRGVGALDAVRGKGEFEVVVAGDKTVDDVDLADRLPERIPERDEVRVHKGRPELHSDPALAEPGDVGGQLELDPVQIGAGRVEVTADHIQQRTRQVVMPVGEGDAPQYFPSAIHEFRSDPGRKRLSGGGGAHPQSGEEGEKAMKGHGDPFPGEGRPLTYMTGRRRVDRSYRPDT